MTRDGEQVVTKVTGVEISPGINLWPGQLSRESQASLIADIRRGIAKAPLFVPRMPRTGKAMSVKMTNFGTLGWVTDKESGYRYQPTHPQTGENWPAIPPALLALWEACAECPVPPEACLINWYESDARMGLHQDRDEETFDAPVLSVSLGDTCLFRFSGRDRKGKTQSVKLQSGDVLRLSGPARLAFHGVDRIYPGTSTLLDAPGRLNVTLRRVTGF